MNPRWLDLSDEWEQQPKFYDRPWNTEEMIEILRFAQNDIGECVVIATAER